MSCARSFINRDIFSYFFILLVMTLYSFSKRISMCVNHYITRITIVQFSTIWYYYCDQTSTTPPPASSPTSHDKFQSARAVNNYPSNRKTFNNLTYRQHNWKLHTLPLDHLRVNCTERIRRLKLASINTIETPQKTFEFSKD